MSKPKVPQLPSQTGVHALTTKPQLDDVLEKYQRMPTSRLLVLGDATGSMLPAWKTTTQQITEMIRRILEFGSCEVRSVAYRDFDAGEKIIESTGWHADPEPLLKFIDSVECIGGQDWEEAVEKGLEVAADDPRATRIILIGDAAPHQQGDYRHQARRLRDLQRPVFSFVVGHDDLGYDEDALRTFREISEITGGTSTRLKDVSDLLDVVVLTAADEIGGKASVQRYLEKYAGRITEGGKGFAHKLIKAGS